MTVFSLGDDQAGGGTGPPVPSGSDSRLRDAGTAVPLCTSSAKQESVMTIEAMIEQPITLESCLAILRQLSPSHEARTNREPPSNAPQPQRTVISFNTNTSSSAANAYEKRSAAGSD
ncbi:unnamed protein product [Parascedosporium putredinis]|uniref:Uncharacterized protein n=1 Tax=Parascedosporium putredinis TaxID=1442378 RepID=A0A9P1M9U7_9PEZI|nr:unnamed protein product [Parascedosporium putredinis]CAI7996241.1 unnamed protein product [Parascedosporium putredinis]